MDNMHPADIVSKVCEYLRDENIPVHFDSKTSTCTIRKSDGIDITLSDGDIIIRNRKRDTLFVFTEPTSVERVLDVYHSEDVVRIKGKDGVLEIRYPVVGDRRLRLVVSFDVDKDGDIDAAAVRVWK